MRKLALGLIGAAALSLGLAMPGLAGAADPVKPAAGDPPQTSGEGASPRQPVSPPAVVPKESSDGAGSGSSVAPAASPGDERSAREREEDERRATERKDKMKKRPGYKDDVPAPRASRV